MELFAGTRSISKAFERRGHKTFCVEWNTKFEGIDLYKDVGELTADEILEKFGRPDVVWISMDCRSFSVADRFYIDTPRASQLIQKLIDNGELVTEQRERE